MGIATCCWIFDYYDMIMMIPSTVFIQGSSFYLVPIRVGVDFFVPD